MENFWPQSFNKMGRRRGNKDKNEASSKLGDTQDGNVAESDSCDGLHPALAKALGVMTSNIPKVINEKLSPLAEAIRKHDTEFQAAGKCLDEAEARLLAVENSTAVHEPRIVELEKQVSTLMERWTWPTTDA